MKNQNRWKDMLAGALVVTAVAGLAVPALAATGSRNVRVDYSDIKLVINGETVTPKDGDGNVVEPFTIDGTTYLPVRAVANALGMDVSWNGNTNTVTLTGGVDDVSGDYIGKAKAKEVALDHAGLTYSDVSFVRVELDWDDGQPQYEVEFYAGNKEYDYEINAKTGKIIESDRDVDGYDAPDWDDYWDDWYDDDDNNTSSGSVIGSEKAQQIARNKAGSGATVVKCQLDWDDGRQVYELELRNGRMEYECDIDAKTGSILNWESDYDD